MGKVSLEDFVQETLLSIARGVRKAKDLSKAEDIIPIALYRLNDVDTKNGDQLVKFSVSLEVSSASSKGAGGKIGGPLVSLVTGSASVDASSKKNQNSLHHIEFSVPINFSARWKSGETKE